MTRDQLIAFAFAGVTCGARVVGQAPSPPQPPAATRPAGPSTQLGAANVEEGKKLYVSYGCYQCHGYEAQGSNATGPRLGPRPIAFAAFSKYTRQPTGLMPPYTTKVMSDADMANVYAFVQSRPTPPPVQSIPLLKP
jgi:cytochrome c553